MSTMLKLAALFLPLWLLGCAEMGKTGAPPSTASLLTTEWLLEDLGGKGVIDNAQATLAFPEADTVAGNATCNRFFGTVAITGATVKFGKLATTRRMCAAEALSKQEAEYLQALENAEQIKLDGPYLLIISKGLDKPLRFTKSQAKKP